MLEWLSLPLLLLLWQVLATVFAHRLFPSPILVAQEMWDTATAGRLLLDLGKTLARVAMAFVVAMLLGTALGIVFGRIRWVDRLFSGWLLVGLNLPAIVVAIVLYIWLGLTEVALVLAVIINKLPLVVTTVREGVRSFATEFDELGRVFRLSRLRRLRLIFLPQLLPFVLAAARTGLSLIWKIVLVFEVLGSDGGVGYRIAIMFQFFDIAGILAYTASFILVVLAFEYGVLRPLERRALKWRPVQG
ncbi:NitT/TauT family transport system permease protein [Devosia sp. YR412]|uniref:ABC transporter permease n=1 Tax=Devosia sp. YR412 TaxID=1881030 RepID=UPI0008CCFB37|nr:ABC transporter permease subunit [Devosia sp. YR412]SEP64687.1 NitT/TauT family transport system permease protein [Devosia sp. YR412]